jgi:hypothetical protein
MREVVKTTEEGISKDTYRTYWWTGDGNKNWSHLMALLMIHGMGHNRLAKLWAT